jgi:hypothetical protein
MALSAHDQSSIREYLLGHLSNEEQEHLEERLIVDDDLCEELEISKGEIIEEYRAGELPEKDRQWLESNYLRSREGRERYSLAVAISCLNNRTAQPRDTWFVRLRNFLTLHPWAVATATAAVLIVVLAGIWFSRSRPGTVVTFALTSTVTRRGQNNSEIYKLKHNRDADELRVSLALPNSTPAGARYRAELDNGHNTKAAKVIGQEGNSIVVSMTASDVPIGYYALRLFATPPGGSEQELPGDYRFIVE